MNLVFIRYFLALAASGNFTAAAERCHVTQPTLSAGIARLEAELGPACSTAGARAACRRRASASCRMPAP
ncbi:MAG: LysR family transcriptional regulator [Reyranellaceae bacterium]